MKRKWSAVLAVVIALMLALPLSTSAHWWPTYHNGTTAAESFITAAQAQGAALSHAGVKEADAVFLATVSYPKHLTHVHKVIFVAGNTCYIYEIDSYSGSVLASYTHPWYSGTQDIDDTDCIGEAEAKRIALSHAGWSEASLSKFTCKLKTKDKRLVYEVEFKAGKVKYEYRIDALTGDVIRWEQN